MNRRVGHLRRRDSQAWAFCVLALLVTFLVLLFVAPSPGGTGRVHPPASGPVPAAVPAPSPAPTFLIGVWYQPVSSFGTWKARGVNTLVGYEGEGGAVSRAEWTAAARAAGLCYIIKPPDDAAGRLADLADSYLLAWEQQDEPDGAGNQTPEEIVARYKAWKLVGNKPVFINFDGWKMQWRPAADYQTYAQGGDWLGLDYYVINRGEGADAIPKIGAGLDKLAAWGGAGKRRIAFIECSDQNLRIQDWAGNPDASGAPPGPRMRCPTAAEVLLEVKTAVDHGASGIVYFPDIVGKNFEGFDGTPPALVDTLVSIAQQLTGSPSPPPAVPATRPAADPLAGKTIMIDGRSYKLQSN